MVPIMSLWLPILLSAVIVFIASSIIHMVFSYHYSDFKKAPDESRLLDSLRGLNIPPGEYIAPFVGSAKAMKSPEVLEKMKKGPRLILTIWEGGDMAMGKYLVQWFLYTIVIGIFAAYVAGRALGPGANYLSVFRFAGVTAFACYNLAHWQDFIWYKRSMSRMVTGTIDGLVYALLTAGTFGWLWPM